MATLKDYFNTGDNNGNSILGSTWCAQTFTASSSYTIGSVKLKLWKAGSPGTFTVSIRAVDGSNHPTGSDLASGTINGNDLGASTGAFVEISLTSYALTSGTSYAIVCRATGGSAGNYVAWRDATGDSYAGGSADYSTNSGSSWDKTPISGEDFMFETYEANTTYTLTTAVGAYVLTGVNVVFRGTIKMITETASYALTGIDATFSKYKGYALSALVGVYNFIGKNIGIQGTGSWLWTHGTKPSSTYTNNTKPTSTWTNDNK